MATLLRLPTRLSAPLLRELAGEAPSTLRTLATVGGTVVVADPESELVAALLAYDAEVALTGSSGTETVHLAAVLGAPEAIGPRLLTAVTIATDGRSAVSRTGRTPADRAIVAAVAAEATVMCAWPSPASPTPILVDERGGIDPERLLVARPPTAVTLP
jgi:CO/xanthine dehydrogenase FAD-binding subunit